MPFTRVSVSETAVRTSRSIFISLLSPAACSIGIRIVTLADQPLASQRASWNTKQNTHIPVKG